MRHRMLSLLSPRSEHRLLSCMLVVLHLALWWDFPGAVSRSLMLIHLGIFLIWQPLWSREHKLEWGGLTLFFLLTAAFIWWLNWWLIAFWMVLLIGLIGGRVGQRRADRAAYMIGACFLVFELIIWVVPEMFAVKTAVSAEMTRPLGFALFALPALLMTLSGKERESQTSGAVDFLYGVTVALLVIVLVLGSLLSMYHFGAPYAVALLETVLGISVFLLAISWLWTPFAGFAGFGQLWARYLLNVGTPFERWLADVSSEAAQHQAPERFLEGALVHLVELPWVSGCQWHVESRTGLIGIETPFPLDIETRELKLCLFTPRPITTGLQLHGQLLVRLLADFYQAKRREQELANQAHIRAVHETGARVTHDIKNLLQSLYAMTSAVEAGGSDRPHEVQALLARQFPHLTQRLQLALDKLQEPQTTTMTARPLSDWWEALRRRNDAHRVKFKASLHSNPSVPSEFLDSVVENLLENARFKRQSESDLTISVALDASENGLQVLVSDTGTEIPPEVVESLFHRPVLSRSGLGIGLYQSATQALELGFELDLLSNREGCVSFLLQSSGMAFESPQIMKNDASPRRMPLRDND